MSQFVQKSPSSKVFVHCFGSSPFEGERVAAFFVRAVPASWALRVAWQYYHHLPWQQVCLCFGTSAMFSDTYSLMVSFQETDKLNCYMNENRLSKINPCNINVFTIFTSMLGWILHLAWFMEVSVTCAYCHALRHEPSTVGRWERAAAVAGQAKMRSTWHTVVTVVEWMGWLAAQKARLTQIWASMQEADRTFKKGEGGTACSTGGWLGIFPCKEAIAQAIG